MENRSLKRTILIDKEDQVEDNDLFLNYYKRYKYINDNNNNSSFLGLKNIYSNNNNNSFNFNSFNNNNYGIIKKLVVPVLPQLQLFDFLSIEIIIKIFNYCNPFYTPLIYVCRDWYQIVRDNKVSLWKELKISINSNNKPILFSPKKSLVLSYFNNGHWKSLQSFSINSIDFKPVMNSPKRNKRPSHHSYINNNNHNNNNSITSFSYNSPYHQSESTTINCINNYSNINNSNSNISSILDNSSNINNMIDYKFLKNIINSLASIENHNLRTLELILPVNQKQLNMIMKQCSNLKSLCFNSLLINDDEFKQIFSQHNHRLKQLSVMIVGQYSNLEEFNNKKNNNWSNKSTLSPMSLYSISAMSSLKTLKFSLLPHFGNYKSIAEQQSEILQSSHEGQEFDRCTSSLGKLTKLRELELSSCAISGTVIEDLIVNSFEGLNKLVLYRNSSLAQLKFTCNTLQSIQLSCLSILEYIEINSSSLEEFVCEGCEALQSTLLFSPNLLDLSFESCSGRLSLMQADRLQNLSLFECSDLTQQSLEDILDSLPSLETLCIYLQQIQNLRLASATLKSLDIEAWSGLLTCVLDCPSLEDFKASESTIETLYLKGNNISNIALDFCDSLRTVLIDVLSCNHFSFTQNHPYKGYLNLPPVDQDEQAQIEQTELGTEVEEDSESRINRSYFLSTNLFLQSQNFIQNCIVLSSNIVGKISTKVVGSLSIEQKSQSTFYYNISKICKFNIYKESSSGKGSSPKFIPIPIQSPTSIHNNNYYLQQQQYNNYIMNSQNCNSMPINCNTSYYSTDSRDSALFDYIDEYGGNSNYLFNGFK